MYQTNCNLLLADDDLDDCIFFKEVLEDLKFPATLTTVNDGVDLMQRLLQKPVELPDIIFLDINMPRKTGLECLTEIKENEKLKHLPVIIFSTSLNMEVANLCYEKGADYYVRKPGEFSQLKRIILKALTICATKKPGRPSKDKFILQS